MPITEETPEVTWLELESTKTNGIIVSHRTKATRKRRKVQEFPLKQTSDTLVPQLYDYFLITDFEATCEASKAPIKYDQEIIEFPVYRVDAKTFAIEDVFHTFVRPTLNPILSNFCSKLTGISQSDVANKPTLKEALESLDRWMLEGILKPGKKFIFVTSGDWDLKKMLPEECWRKNVDMPQYFHPYINVNKSFAYTMGMWPRSGRGRISAMLRLLNLAPAGQFHHGTSDCENIIKIMKALAERGHVFKPLSLANS